MIARRFFFPTIRSPDCGYSSTKSSESSRSWASQSLAAIACMYCSAILRLSAILLPPLAQPPRLAPPSGAYASRQADKPLRADVLVESEDVIGVERPLERAQALVFDAPVDRTDHILALLDHVIHIVPRPREGLYRGHRRPTPSDVLLILVPL